LKANRAVGTPSAGQLRAAFETAPGYTVGLEEELLLLDPLSLELTPRAPEVLEWLEGDPRFKLELPASQLEIVTRPQPSVAGAAEALMAARRDLVRAVDGRVLVGGAGVSPLGSGCGELNPLPRYRRTLREYGSIARRQLVCALQVHVAVPGADRALAVYNQARAYLPWLAALAANARFYEGRDTGLASVRPKLSQLLPRQGIPPPLESWERYAEALSWGARTGTVPDPGTWWWELRPHPRFGTLEFRVPDSQPTVSQAAAIAGVIQALVVWLAENHDAGRLPPAADTWRLEENRWSACRDGVEGSLCDPHTADRRSTRECLSELLEALGELGTQLGSAAQLSSAASMIEANAAIQQRQAGGRGGARAVAGWLTERFLEPWTG
jgi:carboxylate-amine ligase